MQKCDGLQPRPTLEPDRRVRFRELAAEADRRGIKTPPLPQYCACENHLLMAIAVLGRLLEC